MQRSVDAIVFPSAGVAEIRHLPLPSVAADEIVVKTLFSMVSSGTELRVFSGKGEATDRFPLIPGYSIVGEVIEIGPAVKGYRVGDLVSGRNPDKAGSDVKLVYGGQQSYHVYATSGYGQPIVLPKGAEPLNYIIAEVAAISGRGVDMAAPVAGETAIVVGQGLVGALSAAWLVDAGCKVIVVDMADRRLERADGWGVAAAINGAENVAARIETLSPGGADIVVDASANPAGFKLACSLLRPVSHGWGRPSSWPRLVVQASYNDPVSMHPTGFAPGDGVIVLKPGDRRPEDRAAAVEAIRAGRLPTQAFVDKILPYTDAITAYAQLRDDPNSVFSLIFDWSTAPELA
ncbi:MAG TPA: zinc-binding dehydrogenase [Capsulimonadaceae bacterium]|jgi:2-desacetyl-2-hydroxyethyl bacteriochlorophyllide A dehydrogenase